MNLLLPIDLAINRSTFAGPNHLSMSGAIIIEGFADPHYTLDVATRSGLPKYFKKSPVRPCGLLNPVRVISEAEQDFG